MLETVVKHLEDFGGRQMHKNFYFKPLRIKSMNINSKFALLKNTKSLLISIILNAFLKRTTTPSPT